MITISWRAYYETGEFICGGCESYEACYLEAGRIIAEKHGPGVLPAWYCEEYISAVE